MTSTCFKRFLVFYDIHYEGPAGWNALCGQGDDLHEAEKIALAKVNRGTDAQIVDLATGEVYDIVLATVDGVFGPIVSLRAVPL